MLWEIDLSRPYHDKSFEKFIPWMMAEGNATREIVQQERSKEKVDRSKGVCHLLFS